jgi:cytochrome P450
MTSAATTENPTDPFLSEEFHTDPNAVIARMRVEDPVHQIPGLGAWMLTRYDDVRALFTHPDATNDRRVFVHYQAPENPMARWIAENSPFAAPPEQHARMRRLVSAALTPRAVKRMEGQVRDVVLEPRCGDVSNPPHIDLTEITLSDATQNAA